MDNVRKILQNEIISQFEDLKKDDNVTSVFEVVEKFFVDIPQTLPACYIQNSQTTVIDRDLSFDQLAFSFNAIIYELVESNSTQSDMDTSIDRLTDADWSVYKLIGKIPSNFEAATSYSGAFKVYDSQYITSNYFEQEHQQGVGLFLSINFDLKVQVNVKLL